MALGPSRVRDEGDRRPRHRRALDRARPLPDRLKSTRPRRHQLEEILEGLIAASVPGDPLPSERELADRYGVARMTARQAIEALASKGLVYRLQGSGTFVAEAKFVQPETLTSFSEDMRARQMNPGSTVLRQELMFAADVVAGRLRLAPGSPVVYIQRLRTADGAPMALEAAYLPARRFPGLHTADLEGTSLYRLLQQRWGVRIRSADQWVAPVALDSEEAELLGVDRRQPAFRFQRCTYDAAGIPIEYVISLYRGDRYEVHTRLERRDLSLD